MSSTIEERKAKQAAASRRWRRNHPDRHKAAIVKHRQKLRTDPELREKHSRSKALDYAAHRRWEQRNKEHMRAVRSAWYQKNKERLNAKSLVRYKSKKKEILVVQARYLRRRRSTDLEFLLISRMRSRIAKVLAKRGAMKSARTEELLGCSLKSFFEHIEAQFLPGMTWQNRHLWHIDHRLPCKNFDLTDPRQQLVCFHFTNLRPLWAIDNMKKGARVETN